MKLRQLVLELVECLTANFLRFDASHRSQLVFQVVEKQRVDYLVNVFHAGVVHTASASGHGIERTLKHRTENGG